HRGRARAAARAAVGPRPAGERMSHELKRVDAQTKERVAIIADDEDLGRLLLASTAEECGLTPIVFDNGADALEAALANDTAIVLLDVEMPRLDGYSVCR